MKNCFAIPTDILPFLRYNQHMFRPMRRFKQQIADSKCKEILKNEKRGVLSLLGDDGYPYGLPLSHLYSKEGDWALNIKSVIVFGKIRLVTDPEKAREICTKLTQKFTDDQ